MPLYEYQCRECSHRFETLVRDRRPVSCPSCASQNLEKLLSVFATASGAGASAVPAGACPTCLDPRGPGACSMN